jgi:serine/threonine protein kinase
MRKFGPYRLISLIGTGGMGEVWSAVHVELRMPCAIKLMKAGLQLDDDYGSYEQMFLNEASICAQLRHGSIVRVHNAGILDGQLFIAMDLVDGANLRGIVRALMSQTGKLLPLTVVAHIVAEILEALDYAHNRTIGTEEGGVIHGDISPGNIMISSYGEVLLTDFGLACFVGATAPGKLLVGTPAYMAPEQARGQMCRESDLYSMGAVLHELLTGRPPVAKSASFAEVATLEQRPIPPLLRDDVPQPIEELRRGLLEPRVDCRIGSAGHALSILEHWPDHRRGSSELRHLYQEHIGRSHSGLTLFGDMRSESHGSAHGKSRALAMSLEDTRRIDEPVAPSVVLAFGDMSP